MTIDGVRGVRFAVWAPNARAVSVVGDFDTWDPRRHPMRLRFPAGVWELFVPRLAPGARYKFAITGPDGARLPLKADPLARATEAPPATASVVVGSARRMSGTTRHGWRDRAPPPCAAMRRSRSMRCMPRRGSVRTDARPELGRARRAAGALCQRDGLHPRRADAGRGASVRRLVGLPAARPVRAERAVRAARGLRPLRRCVPPRRDRRHRRLGAGAFPDRCARPGALRRHRALRARRSARGIPSGLEHLHLQLSGGARCRAS